MNNISMVKKTALTVVIRKELWNLTKMKMIRMDDFKDTRIRAMMMKR